ncbi:MULTISPECIES: prolipoprotein diacylglyceryl transferase [unclassified Halanaerobium]|uniref:prolipoprotein diacylglyceryl transferase n=1 Tax=unclassified Halanaerobium TaxID=2641197 RepID=UPI000E11DA56|nr:MULTISPECIES: prolipoprotein diacylglyceryl transferase [unclassified Halanaerobium]RCW51408.1 prolipoprotein diacylglyceryl transferase [Halanaerobium sp. MA284_MarDTE_T2]RCW89197.1 prolipoprotein diacylglyceryl transferase [Halanaerobium sp. DL-01]
MNPVLLQIGNIEIRWYGVLIITSIFISLCIINKLLKKERFVEIEFFLDFLIYGIPVSILGARLYYVLFNYNYYFKNPSLIFSIWRGGLAIHGAAFSGVAVLYYLSRKRNVPFLKLLDIISPAFAFAQSIGRWGNFFNRESYGRIVGVEYINHFPDFIKKQMYIGGVYREPTFLYESLFNLILFFYLMIYYNFSDKDGNTFAYYLLFYSAARYVIEDFRTDSLMLADLQVAQIVSVFLIMLSLFIIVKNSSDS